jgi:hypothetical protein
MLNLETSMNLLEIANLIASREMNCCEADVELAVHGNWLSDHTATDKRLDDEITQKIKAIRAVPNTEAKSPACPFCKCTHLRLEKESEGEWYVVCGVCAAHGPMCDTEERARWYWSQAAQGGK